jgi:hypothetical protein
MTKYLIPKNRVWFFAMISSIAFGQAAEDSWSCLNQLRGGQKIEVVDMKMKSVTGSFIAVSEEAITLLVGSARTSIPQSDVLSVKNRASGWGLARREVWQSALSEGRLTMKRGNSGLPDGVDPNRRGHRSCRGCCPPGRTSDGLPRQGSCETLDDSAHHFIFLDILQIRAASATMTP